MVKKIVVLGFLSIVLLNIQIKGAANISGYDTTRIFKAMAKVRNGEDITIGVFGGSITAGSLASTENKRWANLMTDWWETTFPESNISLINAGIGGTGSDIGVHRIQDDLLKSNPDFVVIEFAVNDAGMNSTYVQQMMEGIVRQLMKTDAAIMFLLLKMEIWGTAQEDHKVVGNYYKIPMVSFADLIDSALTADGKVLRDVYGDNPGVHPNDLGMQYIADFIIDELNIIYDNLPADTAICEIIDTLPNPLITDLYEHTYQYTNYDLVPYTNKGWITSGKGWKASEPGSEISFKIDGNAFSILYSRHNTTNRGRAEVWIDDTAPVVLDAYWTETWGPATVFSLLGENFVDGEHILHLKVINETSAGSEGHLFELINVLKAGNLKNIAPIAVTKEKEKVLVNTEVILDGTKSFDPDSSSDLSYQWSFISKPSGSESIIMKASSAEANITPDIEGNYRIGLIVNDSIYNSVQAIKMIHVVSNNTIPVANAGEDKVIPVNKTYTLNGENSIDANGDPLIYKWRIISQPESSNIKLTNIESSTPKIFPLKEGEYSIGLIVNDSITDSEEDIVILTASSDITEKEDLYFQKINFQVFPNPVQNKLYVSYKLFKNDFIDISIYSIDGQKITNLLYEIQNQGFYNYEFNIYQVIKSKGIYIVKCKAGRFEFIDKLIVI